jgi:tetratricopeptide (TPR) repeat protein
LDLVGGLKNIAAVFLSLLVLGLAGFSSVRHDASRNFAVEDVGKGLLLQMPAHSALYSEGDAVTFPLAYLNMVEKLRPDLAIFDRTGGLFKNLYHLLDYHGITPAQQVTIEKEFESTRHPATVFYTENTDAPGRPLTMTGLLFQATDGGETIQSGTLLWNLFRVPRINLDHDYFSRETACRYYLFKAPYDLDIQKNTTAGMEDLRIGKELGFDNYRLLLNAGLAENNHDWTDQAALTFEKSSEINPEYFLSWYDRGVVAEKQNNYTQAVVLFQKAIKLAPDYTEAHQHLGYLYYQSRRMDEAIQEWELVRKLDPLYAGAYRNLGYAFKDGQPDYAAQMFREYLALAPGAPDRTNLEKWLASQRR